jgi:hypothetical protein
MEYDGVEKYGANQRSIEIDIWVQYYGILASRAIVSARQSYKDGLNTCTRVTGAEYNAFEGCLEDGFKLLSFARCTALD